MIARLVVNTFELMSPEGEWTAHLIGGPADGAEIKQQTIWPVINLAQGGRYQRTSYDPEELTVRYEWMAT